MVFVALFVLALIALIDFEDYYGCAISRLPIYCYGIWFFQNQKCKRLTKDFAILNAIFLFVLLVSVLLQRKGYFINGPFLVDMLCPTLLLAIAYVLQLCGNIRNPPVLNSAVSYLGNHTLEVYIANYLSMGLMGLFAVSDCYVIAGLYLLINIALSICLIATNKMISKFV